jgi:hypothetical protein
MKTALLTENETETNIPANAIKKPASKPPVKKPLRVEKKLAAKKSASKSSAVEKPESADTTGKLSAPAPTVEVSKSVLSKCKRAYKKAGVSATDETVIAFANSLIVAGVKILSKSSSRIARVVKGEVEIKDLC